MSKRTSRTQLKAHNTHLKQQMQITKKKARQRSATIPLRISRHAMDSKNLDLESMVVFR